jgi:hypothetical protein
LYALSLPRNVERAIAQITTRGGKKLATLREAGRRLAQPARERGVTSAEA